MYKFIASCLKYTWIPLNVKVVICFLIRKRVRMDQR